MTNKTKFHKWDDNKGDVTPERRARIDAIKGEMQAEQIAYSLAEIRRACEVTQTALADRLGTAQPNISAIEKSADHKLSTINELATALGRELGVEGRVEITMVLGEDRYPLR